MKRLMSFILLLSLLCGLTGCMSIQEREKAKDIVKAAKPQIEAYVLKNYGEKGKITDITCISYNADSIVPDFGLYASNYAKGTVRLKNEVFQVIMDTNTGEGFDNRYYDKISASFNTYVQSTLGKEKPESIELCYYQNEICKIDTDQYEGFTKPNTMEYKELLDNDEYEIYAVFKYVSSSLDFSRINGESLFPKDKDFSKIYMGFINYRNKERYQQAKGFKLAARQNFINGLVDHCYYIDQLYTASKERVYDEDTGSFKYSDLINTDYIKFSSAKAGDIEMIWIDDCYNISITQVEAAKELVLEQASVTSLDGKAFVLDITYNKELRESSSYVTDNIDLYFDGKFKDNFIVNSQTGVNEGKQLERWNNYGYEGGSVNYCRAWLDISDEHTQITVGLYKDKYN